MSIERRRMMLQQDGYPEWMLKAHSIYGLSLNNLKKAFTALPEIKWCFEKGKTCYLVSDNINYIDTKLKLTDAAINITFIPRKKFISVGLFGYNYNDDGTQRRFSFQWNNASLETYGFEDGFYAYYQRNNTYVLDKKHSIYMNCNGGDATVKKDNETIVRKNNSTRSNPINHYLFATNTNISYANFYGGISICSYKASNGENLAFFIPSQENGKFCMIDLVSGDFFHDKFGVYGFSIEVIDDEEA